MRLWLPASFGVLAFGGLAAVGEIPEILGGPLMYGAVTLASVAMLAAIGSSRSGGRLEVQSAGGMAAAAGVLALSAFAFTPMAYTNPTPRTDWIQGLSLWSAGASMIVALVLVGWGIQQARSGDAGLEMTTPRRTIFAGTALGSAAYLAHQLALAYDLGPA